MYYYRYSWDIRQHINISSSNNYFCWILQVPAKAEQNVSYYNGQSLCWFVCLSAMEICPAARISSKRSIPVEGSLGCVLWAPVFNYLPCCRRLCNNVSSAGQDAILFNIILSSLRMQSGHPKNMTLEPVDICMLTAPHHNSQIPLLCLHNTLHFQRLSYIPYLSSFSMPHHSHHILHIQQASIT